ncbi:MAG: DUF11 domain-containing protein, partial [Nitrospiraceae bacterium]
MEIKGRIMSSLKYTQQSELYSRISVIAVLAIIIAMTCNDSIAAGVTRTLSTASLAAGEVLEVTLTIDVDPQHTTYGVDDSYPVGWAIESFCSESPYGHVILVATTGASDTTCTYQLRAPGIPGIYYFSGTYNFGEGDDQIIDGDNTVVVTADTTIPPSVLGTIPLNDITNIIPPDEIRVIFNKEMNRSVTESAWSITPEVEGTLRWENNILIYEPSNALSLGTEYTVRISATAQDTSGKLLDGNINGVSEGSPSDDYIFRFRIMDKPDEARVRRYFNKPIVRYDEALEVLLVIDLPVGVRYYIIEDNRPLYPSSRGWTVLAGEANSIGVIKLVELFTLPGTHYYRYTVKPPESNGVYKFSGHYILDYFLDSGDIGGQSEVIVVGAPEIGDLSVSMTYNPSEVLINSNLIYTITVTNNGPGTANGVAMTFNMNQAGNVINMEPSQGSCAYLDGIVTCYLDTLESGETATISIIARPNMEGSIRSTASVTSEMIDTITDNNTVTQPITVYPVFKANKAVTAPVIDGDLSEYEGVDAVTLSPLSGGNTVTVRTL